MTEQDYKHWLQKNSGWILIGIFCLIPVILLFIERPIADSFNTWNKAFANFGRLVGLIGFLLYAINMLISVRQRWLEGVLVV